MICQKCQKQLSVKNIPYNINRKGYDVILRDVPAFVCDECGEIFFDEKSVNQIQEMVKNLDDRYEAVRSYRPTAAVSQFAYA